MLKPEFPYKGNQLILMSDRVHIHSKSDAIFLFGKAAIGLSSTKTINLDSPERVIIASPKIELGLRAETEGQPVILGQDMVNRLKDLVGVLKDTVGPNLAQAASTNLAATTYYLQEAGKVLTDTANAVYNSLDSTLSSNTYTK